MARVALLGCLLFAAFAVRCYGMNPLPKCGLNEGWAHCKSTCGKTCEHPVGGGCVYLCEPGCECLPNFLRNSRGVCVPEAECQKHSYIGSIVPSRVCYGEHEEYKECKDSCTKTCENPHGAGACTYECLAGCDCQRNYLRDASGRCVHESTCFQKQNSPIGIGPRCVGQNEIWSTCNYHCPETCDTRFEERVCRGCNAGCVCKPNHYRNNNGVCVHESECPIVHHQNPIVPHHNQFNKGQCRGPNEVFAQCKDTCQKSCERPNGRGICTQECRTGCDCLPNYYRNPFGECVHISDCHLYKNTRT